MSQQFVLRKALTTVEAPLLVASEAAYFFRTIYISNATNNTHDLYLAITAGRAFATQGDWIVNAYDIAGHTFLRLENILIPVGHELRGYSDSATALSLVGSGVME
jgi:hypothetical protein